MENKRSILKSWQKAAGLATAVLFMCTQAAVPAGSCDFNLLRPLANTESEGRQLIPLPRAVSVVCYSELPQNDPKKAAFGYFINKYRMPTPQGDYTAMHDYVIDTDGRIVRNDELHDPSKRSGKSDRIILMEGNTVVGMLAFTYNAADANRIDYDFIFVTPGARNEGYGLLLWEAWFDVLDKVLGTSADRELYFVRRIGECHFWNKVIPRLRQRGINGTRIGFKKAWDLVVTCTAGNRFGLGIGDILDLEHYADMELHSTTLDELAETKRILSLALIVTQI